MQELAQLALEFNTTSRESEPYGEGTTDRVALRVAEELVRQIGLRMGHGLADPAVPPRIACHLTRVFARLRHRLPIRNPLTDDVRQSFPELWRATAEAVGLLQDELEISLPPQEIAFLTLYLALAFRIKHGLAEQRRRRVMIACPSGGVTVSILRSRLQAEFPDVEIVGVTSLKHLAKVDLSSVDALITTAPVRARGTPVIVVSPLLPETNIARIRDVFGMSRAVPAESG
jgi:mannitol operon transcriptional antiterminator